MNTTSASLPNQPAPASTGTSAQAAPTASFDPSNGHPVHPTRYAATRRLGLATTGRIALTMASMLGMMAPAFALMALLSFGGVKASRPMDIAMHCVVLVSAVLLARWLRGRFEGDPARYLAAGWEHGKALVALMIGLGVAAVLIGSGLAAGAAAGTLLTMPGQGDLLVDGLYVFTVSFFLQAIPEELLWRGYLQTTLMTRLSPVLAAVLSAVFFGSMHVLSIGSGDTVASKAVYILGAMVMGLAMAALRLVTGSTWAAVGYHAGFHLTTRIPGLFGIGLGPETPLWAQIVPLALEAAVGITLLVVWQRRHGHGAQQ